MTYAKYPVQRAFYVTRELSEALDALSAQIKKRKGQICREALAEYIEKKRGR